MFPLRVSISSVLLTTWSPVFSFADDTPLTVLTLTPVSVDLMLPKDSEEPVLPWTSALSIRGEAFFESELDDLDEFLAMLPDLLSDFLWLEFVEGVCCRSSFSCCNLK